MLIKRRRLLQDHLPMIYSLEQLEEHYEKVKKEQNFDHVKCVWALKDVYAQLAELQYEQIQKLPTFIQENEKRLESFGLLYFINRKNQLVKSYPSGFFNGWEPAETEISLRDLKLSPAEIAKTWAMTK